MLETTISGLPANVLGQIFREEPSAEIVVVADRMADDHADLLAAVVVRGGLSECEAACCGQEAESEQEAFPDAISSRLLTFLVTRVRA